MATGPSNLQRGLVAERLGDELVNKGWSALEGMPRHEVNQWIDDKLHTKGEHPTQRGPTGAQSWRMHELGVDPVIAQNVSNEEAKAIIDLMSGAGVQAEDIPGLRSMPPTSEQVSRIRSYGYNGQTPSSFLEAEGTLTRLEHNRGLTAQQQGAATYGFSGGGHSHYGQADEDEEEDGYPAGYGYGYTNEGPQEHYAGGGYATSGVAVAVYGHHPSYDDSSDGGDQDQPGAPGGSVSGADDDGNASDGDQPTGEGDEDPEAVDKDAAYDANDDVMSGGAGDDVVQEGGSDGGYGYDGDGDDQQEGAEYDDDECLVGGDGYSDGGAGSYDGGSFGDGGDDGDDY